MSSSRGTGISECDGIGPGYEEYGEFYEEEDEAEGDDEPRDDAYEGGRPRSWTIRPPDSGPARPRPSQPGSTPSCAGLGGGGFEPLNTERLDDEGRAQWRKWEDSPQEHPLFDLEDGLAAPLRAALDRYEIYAATREALAFPDGPLGRALLVKDLELCFGDELANGSWLPR